MILLLDKLALSQPNGNCRSLTCSGPIITDQDVVLSALRTKTYLGHDPERLSVRIVEERHPLLDPIRVLENHVGRMRDRHAAVR